MIRFDVLFSQRMHGGAYFLIVLLLAPVIFGTVYCRPHKGETLVASHGHELFLVSCAHCHGDEGHGDGPDEGADLRDLRKSDARIASTIRNGVKGEMPKFGSKFSDTDIQALIAFLRLLH